MITNREYALVMMTTSILMVFSIGVTMNFVVVQSNGWKMPVLLSYEYNTTGYFSYQEKSEVKYHLLTDRIRFVGSIWSLGDFIMIIGAILWISWIFFIQKEWEKYRRLKHGGRTN